jgi:hypothetical protein
MAPAWRPAQQRPPHGRTRAGCLFPAIAGPWRGEQGANSLPYPGLPSASCGDSKGLRATRCALVWYRAKGLSAGADRPDALTVSMRYRLLIPSDYINQVDVKTNQVFPGVNCKAAS